MKKITVYWSMMLLALLCKDGHAYRRRYNLYLDPSRAEEILAKITLKPRYQSKEWGEVVKDKKAQTYKVRSGDTLWDISQRELGSPRLWGKLWQVNPYLTNPHEIDVGALLNYYAEDRNLASEEWTIPVVKLVPDKSPVEFEDDAVIGTNLRNRSRTTMHLIEESEVLGKVSGSYSERKSLAEMDVHYLEFKNWKDVKVGDRFSVVKRVGRLRDHTKPHSPVLGTMVRFVAEVRVTELGEKFAKAEFVTLAGFVQRGDDLIAPLRPLNWALFNQPPDEMTARIIMAEDPEKKWMNQGDMVMLNKGTEQGMQEGYVFRVYRDRDPISRERKNIDADYKGEVQVIYTSKHASMAYVIRNNDLIKVNDTLVPAQAFADPDESLTREQQIVEIP